MMVYVLCTKVVSDGEPLREKVRVFSKYEKAIAAFENWVDRELRDNVPQSWEIFESTQDFEAWEPGNYVNNNSVAFVEELVLE